MGGKSAADTGPDNNKRLAFLEGRAALLHEAIIASRMPFLPEEDDFDVAIRAIGALQEATPAYLAAIDRAEKAEAGRDMLPGLVAGVVALVARYEGDGGLIAIGEDEDPVAALVRAIDALAEKAPPDVALLRERVRGLEEDLGEATRKLAKAQRQGRGATSAKAKSVKARQIGEPGDPIARERLDAAMEDGDTALELVFSTGDAEIIELEPLAATPAAFRKVRGGLYQLCDPLILQGVGTEVRVRGVGLIGAGGDLIGWSGFPEAVKVIPGGTVKLEKVNF